MNEKPFKIILALGIYSLLIFSSLRAGAFALLGPFEPWMQETNALRQMGDIGGPMCISNGYRWNVPTVTYGFDPSFVQYFGTNGVAAVESAIQVLNDLPAASDMVPTNFPYVTTRFNGIAIGQYLLDLKSATLSSLLEQLGLAQPSRYIYVIKQWTPALNPPPNEETWDTDWPDWVFPDYISERNFDPATLMASQYVNNQLYAVYIAAYVLSGAQNFLNYFPLYQDYPMYSAVADRPLELGSFYTGLTYDDTGGLRYLYTTNTVEYETLLPSVCGVGTNSFVNGAMRPGVNKVTFVSQPVNSKTGAFLPMTNCYTDTYLSNGIPVQQRLVRLISQPDFVFCAGNVNFGGSSVAVTFPVYVSVLDRSGTANWINNAALNGNPGGDGPGLIRPPVRITFSKLGTVFFSEGGQFYGEQQGALWGTYDGSTNPPIIYPVSQNGTSQFDIRLLLTPYTTPTAQHQFDWPLTNVAGSVSLFQISSNLTDWTTFLSATNDGTIWTFEDYYPPDGQQFYRVVSQ